MIKLSLAEKIRRADERKWDLDRIAAAYGITRREVQRVLWERDNKERQNRHRISRQIGKCDLRRDCENDRKRHRQSGDDGVKENNCKALQRHDRPFSKRKPRLRCGDGLLFAFYKR